MDAKVMELKKLLDQIAAVKQLRKEARARWDSNTGQWCDVQNRMHEVERLESKLSELAASQLPALITAATSAEQLERLREAVIHQRTCIENYEDASEATVDVLVKCLEDADDAVTTILAALASIPATDGEGSK